MSTHSMIGYEDPHDGSITAIYCHYDGYVRHHLPILHKYWFGLDKVLSLMSMGDLDKLGPVCVRLDAPDGKQARHYPNRDVFVDRAMLQEAADYLYLWVDRQWLVRKTCGLGLHEKFTYIDPLPYIRSLDCYEAEQTAERERQTRLDEQTSMFATAIDELARRTTDPEWGQQAVLIEAHDEERIAWMLGYLRKNADEMAGEWLDHEESEAGKK